MLIELHKTLLLPEDKFRQEIKEIWRSGLHAKITMSYRRSRPIPLGWCLLRVKEDKLYQLWGYSSLTWYCFHELGLRPFNFNQILIAVCIRLRALGFTPQESLILEKHPYKTIVYLTKLCRKRETLEKFFSLSRSQQREYFRKHLDHRKREWLGPVPLKARDYNAFYGVRDFFHKTYKISDSQVIGLMAIVLKSIIEKPHGRRVNHLKRLLPLHEIPPSIATLLFGDEV